MQPHDLHSIRRELIAATRVDVSALHYSKASQAVVNPTNHCSVGCKHCLFSSKIQSGKKEQLQGQTLSKLIKVLSESDVKELVISGGGEPFENFPAVLKLITEIGSLENVVIITSAYFGSDIEDARQKINAIRMAADDDRCQLGSSPVTITLRISRDASYNKTVSVDSVVNVISSAHELFPDMRILLRTLSDDESIDVLAQKLHGQIMHSILEAPIIDGIPCSWLRMPSNPDIPILIKPVYCTGRAKNRSLSATDVWALIDEERARPQSFNLSLRGSRGQGHNYYGTHFLGFDHWKTTLGGTERYQTLEQESRIGIALYCDATGSLGVNAAPPDNHISVESVHSWNDFLSTVFRDPLLNELIRSGPLKIFDIARKAEPQIYEAISSSNFVFSLSLYSMLTQSLRGYITHHLAAKGDTPLSPKLENIISDLYAKTAVPYASALGEAKKLDPIRGGVPTIFDS